jgi:glycosyltransferase involved in cell wall biosynthesis
MKILILTNKAVFPIQDGLDLPIAKLSESFSKNHEVFFLRTYTCEHIPPEFNTSESQPQHVKKFFTARVNQDQGIKALVKELSLQKPNYFVNDFANPSDLQQLKDIEFDWIWVSPEGLLPLAELIKTTLHPKAKISLGINEPQYTVFANKLHNLKKGRENIGKDLLIKIFRLPFIWLNEKSYLKRADLIHVQTQLELNRLNKMLGSGDNKVVVAPNGIKEELFDVKYTPQERNSILLMTQMDGSRTESLDYFLQHVWKPLIKQNDTLTLHLVGKPPSTTKRKDYLESIPGLNIVGFVDEFKDAFIDKSISVVPIFQNHGLINRVVDSLCAGIPTVGFTEVMQTVDGLINNEHALVADNAEEMIQQINFLITNPNECRRLSENAKKLMIQKPNWEKTGNIILNKMTS